MTFPTEQQVEAVAKRRYARTRLSDSPKWADLSIEMRRAYCDKVRATIEDFLAHTHARREMERDAARWRFIFARMVHQRCGPNDGWTLDTLLPGDDPVSAVDAAREREG